MHGKLRHSRLLGVRTDKIRARRGAGDVVITHPEKVLFPDDGITKGRAGGVLRGGRAGHGAAHRAAGRSRWSASTAGIGENGFFQKDVSKGFPEWLERVEVPKKGGTVHHPIVTDTRSLLWLANQNCITPHVWTSRAPDLYQPDICVFDLDPSEDEPGHAARGGARAARPARRARPPELGEDIGLQGFHIVVPLDGKTNMGEVARFRTRGRRQCSVKRDPQHLTQEFHKVDRGRPDPRGHRA